MTESADENAVRYENILKDYMIRLRQLSENSKASLVVLFIPDISQLHHPEVQHINRFLGKICAEQAIPFVDMTPIFEQSSDPGYYYLWPDDPHANERGHRKMAQVLQDLVCHSSGSRAGLC
jgi:lysophospholipase L1-like esterase